MLRYDANPNIFMASVGKDSGEVRLLTSGMLDPVFSFPESDLGPVSFVSSPPRGKARMIGHENGYIKIVSVSSLKVSNIYLVSLAENETLSCGIYNSSGHNFALGTSFGSIYIGNIKRDKMSSESKP